MSTAELIGSHHFSWDADPCARGGYAFFDPSFPPALRSWLAQPCGRIFFAGEHTTNTDDILFQTTGGASSNEGFFANVGDTRRRGFEASLRGRLLEGRLHTLASYTYLDATYRTSFLK